MTAMKHLPPRLIPCRFIHGWTEAAQLEELYRLARDLPCEGDIVEIGCYLGRSTVALAYGKADGGRGGRHVVIDPFRAPQSDPALAQDMEGRGSIKQKFLWNMAAAQIEDYTLFDGTSAQAREREVVSGPVRLAFIDGDHSYEATKHDLEWLAPRMAAGGVIALDDYGAWEDRGWGVRKASDLVFGARPHKLWRLGNNGRAAFVEIAA